MHEKHEKTNAMRQLDRKKAVYTVHSYDGVAALARLGLVSGGGTQVQTDGGLLSVDLDGEDIDLTGPAELTFTGDLPELPA